MVWNKIHAVEGYCVKFQTLLVYLYMPYNTPEVINKLLFIFSQVECKRMTDL